MAKPWHIERKEYPSTGYCPYCLKPPSDPTDEHIIPEFLSGGLVLISSACKSCNNSANERYEQEAAQKDFLIPRLLLELKRKKRNVRRNLPPVFPPDQASEARPTNPIQLDIEQYPPVFPLFHWEVAGHLAGVDRTTEKPKIRINLCALRKWNGPALSCRAITHPMSLALTIAKIGYCYAFAELGSHRFHSDAIRGLLLGERTDIFNFVGDPVHAESLTDRYLHKLHLRQRGDHITVLVHLFAAYRMTPYEVAVGTIA